MCGIFGVLNTQRNPSAGEGRLAAIAGAMKHRGPDAHGIYTDHQVALVHTRLSLVDLSSRSDQPLWDKTGRYERMRINPAYFDRSPLRDWFQVTNARLRFMAENASAVLRLRMLMLDVWGRLYFQGDNLTDLRSRLSMFVRVAAASKTVPSPQNMT